MDADVASKSPKSNREHFVFFTMAVGLSGVLTIGFGSGPIPWLLGFGMILGAMANKHVFRTWSEMGRSSAGHRPALRKRVVIPARVLVATVLVGLGVGSCSVVKDAGFVWDSLPVHEYEEVAYRWPGVYIPDFIVPPGERDSGWYVTGGPYVPLPSDSPKAATERLRRYLDDRFDIQADAARIHALLGDPRPSASEIPGGTVMKHPYATGILAVEQEHQSAAYGVLFRRLLLRALVVLLLGSCLLRAQFWRYARTFAAVGLSVCSLVLLWSTWFDGSEHRAYRLLLPMDRFYARHAWALTIASLAAAAGLLWWARQIVRRLVPAVEGREA